MMYVSTWILSLVLASSPAPSTTATAPERAERAERACVALDEARDQLSPVDRAVLKSTLERVLSQSGLPVGSPCDAPWRVSHQLRGDGIWIVLEARGREVEAHASALAGVPHEYERLAKALLSGAPLARPAPPSPAPTVRAPAAVTPSASSPPFAPRPRAFGAPLPPTKRPPWLLYLKLGAGAVPRLLENTTAVGALGYRHRWDRWAVDLVSHVATMDSADEQPFAEVLDIASLRVSGQYLFSPDSPESWYALGGLGWARTDGELNEPFFDFVQGEGLELAFGVGYELRRTRSLRFLFELGAAWPLYTLDHFGSETGIEMGPVLTLTAGVGWTRMPRADPWNYESQ